MTLIRCTVSLRNPSTPEGLALQLRLLELERREEVLGNGMLRGAIPMEDMDLVLRPQLQQLVVNPESPNIPLSMAKSVMQEPWTEESRAPCDYRNQAITT